MFLSARPSTVLALVLAAGGAQGCLFGCGDLSFEDESAAGTFNLTTAGMADGWSGVVDPNTEEGCESLCGDLFSGTLTSVSSCTAVVHPGASDTDASDTDASGTVDVTCVASGSRQCIGGRHHAALATRAGGRGPTPMAAWLAREAHGEAGSVLAFRSLADELRDHGAPESLTARAMDAARDEVRHARDVRRLAQTHGGQPDPVRAHPPRTRSLRDLAAENAVEGCVHETFAAARAGWQAQHAHDPAMRAVYATLAADEARHADLAADVHAWAMSVLEPQDARAVEDARQQAWRQLLDAIPEDAGIDALLGLPDRATTQRLVAALAQGLGVALA